MQTFQNILAEISSTQVVGNPQIENPYTVVLQLRYQSNPEIYLEFHLNAENLQECLKLVEVCKAITKYTGKDRDLATSVLMMDHVYNSYCMSGEMSFSKTPPYKGMERTTFSAYTKIDIFRGHYQVNKAALKNLVYCEFYQQPKIHKELFKIINTVAKNKKAVVLPAA